MLDECRRIRRGVLDRGTRRMEQFQIALLRQPEFLLEACGFRRDRARGVVNEFPSLRKAAHASSFARESSRSRFSNAACSAVSFLKFVTVEMTPDTAFAAGVLQQDARGWPQ